MGLTHGYGLVIGLKANYYRDPPDNFGRYYHGNINLSTPTGLYHCAIDVDPKQMKDGVQWRVVKIRPRDFSKFKALPDGWHALQSNSSSGALDYIRSPALHPSLSGPFAYQGLLHKTLDLLRWNPAWMEGTGIQALTELESIIEKGVRFYIFGEPFNVGLGVHNIHQNQGDPLGSAFSADNAIWQDGGTIVETGDGMFFGFLNKFKTQSVKTDTHGHPWRWHLPIDRLRARPGI
jgi:hypothetical protein